MLFHLAPKSLIPGALFVLFSCVPVMITWGDSSGPVRLGYELDCYWQANRLQARLVACQLDLERLNLEQVTRLHQDGHASWLEYRRQQAAVNKLEREMEALQQIADAMQSLSQTPGVDLAADASGSGMKSVSAEPDLDLWDRQTAAKQALEAARSTRDRWLAERDKLPGDSGWNAATPAEFRVAPDTLQLAQARASVAGPLAVATAELELKQLQAELARNHARRGLISKNRLEDLQAEMRLAEDERERIEHRFQAWREQTGLSADAPFTLSWAGDSLFSETCPETVADLHALMIHWHRVFRLHLRNGRIQEDLALQQDVLRRLRTVSEPEHTNRPSGAGAARLHSVLRAGEQNQIRSIEAKCRLLQAQWTHNREQIGIARLEHQSQPAKPADVPNYGSAFAGIGQVPAAARQYDRIGYQSAWTARSPLLRGAGGPASVTLATANRKREAWSSRHAPWRAEDTTWRDRDEGLCLGPWSWQTVYPHGILDSQWRYGWPAGYTPWYMPGGPVNRLPCDDSRN